MRMARPMRAVAFLFTALMLLVLSPVASAASTVFVPPSVLGTSVPVRVTDAPAGATVNFTVGAVSVEGTATAGVATLSAPHVATGIDAYTVVVTKGNATPETFTGSVYVDPALVTVTAQLAGANKNITD